MHIYLYNYIINSSIIGKFILLIIIYFSIISIAILFTQMQKLNLIKQQVDQFINLLKEAENLREFYKNLQNNNYSNPIGIIFKNLMKAEMNFKDKKNVLYFEYLKNDVQISFTQVELTLNKYLTLLPFIASITPFLGLIGTIFGIINTFHGISISGNASIAAISPGMSEALMSTGISIFVSLIAASISMYLSNKKNNIINQIDIFTIQTLNQIIVQDGNFETGNNQLETFNDKKDNALDDSEYDEEI